jgi:hypothetical protein
MNTYEEYALIEIRIKDLTEKKEALRTTILEEMVAKGEKKKDVTVGSFTVSQLKSWVYPDKVVAIGEKFKAEKAKAESTGDATYTEKPSLRFTMLKL